MIKFSKTYGSLANEHYLKMLTKHDVDILSASFFNFYISERFLFKFKKFRCFIFNIKTPTHPKYLYRIFELRKKGDRLECNLPIPLSKPK